MFRPQADPALSILTFLNDYRVKRPNFFSKGNR
jgi:hypothetical protein